MNSKLLVALLVSSGMFALATSASAEGASPRSAICSEGRSPVPRATSKTGRQRNRRSRGVPRGANPSRGEA